MKIVVEKQYENWSLRKWARYNLNLPFCELNLFLRKKLIKIDSKLAKINTILDSTMEITVDDSIYFKTQNKTVNNCDFLKENTIFENTQIILVEKPIGISTQGSDDSIAKITNAYIVHRLDKETSGLLLLAKNKSAAEYINAQFRENKVEKHYQAICTGSIDNSGEFTTDIDGKTAITMYKKLDELNDKVLMQFIPVTGKKRQIRIHCAQNNIPVLGDPLYGYEASRMYLNCYFLKFIDPETNQPIAFKSKIKFSL